MATAADSEIRMSLERMIEAMNAGDLPELRARLAERADAIHIGTAPEEW
jgi:hypothetical protein